MRLAKLALVATLVLAVGAPAATAQPVPSPGDGCIGIIHFPDDPIGDAPSKTIVGVAVSPMYAGYTFNFMLSGASGDQMGSGPVGPNGLAFGEAPLFAYGPHQLSGGTLTNGTVMDLDLSSLGDDGAFIVDDAEPPCDPSVLTPIPPETTTTTTTTTSTTTTTEAPAGTAAPETTSAPTTTVTTPVDTGTDDGGGLPWPGILIGGGLIILIAGGIIAMGGKEKNCDRERENLARAQQRLEQINETLEQALNDMEAHEAEIRELEADLESWNKSKQRGHSTEGKVKYYSHDGRRVPDYELEAEIEYLEGLLRIEREAHAFDEERVREWHEKFQKAEQEVREAQEALAKCLGEGAAPAPPTPPPSEPGTAGPSGPSGPSIATSPQEEKPKKECEDGATYSEKGAPEHMYAVVDFAVVVEIVEGSERKVGEAKAMSLGLGEAAAALDLLGKTLGAGGAASSIKGGIGGMAAGEYVMGVGGLAKGTAEGVMASGLTDISIPTSPQEAVVEVVKGVAKLGELVSRKVGEWLVMNQLYNVRLTLFQQKITATPYTNWVCDDDKWKCEKVWQYTVGQLRKKSSVQHGPFRLESNVARHRFESTVTRLGRVAQREIAKSLQERADFDAKHQPKPCE